MGTALVAVGALGLLLAASRVPYAPELGGAVLAIAVLAALAYLAWNVEPAWLLIGGVIGSTFNSNWGALGFPGGLPPDRFVLLAGILGVVFRSAAARDRPPFRFQPVHGLLALTLAWAIGSGVAAQNLGDPNVQFYLLDRLAVPFAIFTVAPLAFHSHRHREGFLTVLVGFGAYLGLTACFEIVGPHALVIPHFILEMGNQPDRAQGPFLEVTTNGVALYACALGSAIALTTWRTPRKRAIAGAVLFLCVVGLLFTLTRSVWLGSVIATGITFMVVKELRRFVLPALATGVAVVLLALLLIPQFGAAFSERAGDQTTVWERRNVNAAALNMVSHRPLLGFGVGTFNERNAEYFKLLSDVPRFSWHATTEIEVHNVFLLFAAELGLGGLALFVASFLAVVGSAARGRGPPEMRPWRIGVFALAVYWVVGANFAPLGDVFPNLIVWLWAGVVLGGVSTVAEPARNGRRHMPVSGPTQELAIRGPAIRSPAVGEGGT